MNNNKMTLLDINQAIINDQANDKFLKLGYKPLYVANKNAKIAILGQAPGLTAQLKGVVWLDQSGDNLRDWLGVTFEEFYNPELFALLPADFYYPGPKPGASGDLPPRKEFALKWHPLLLAQMPYLELIILVGSYAQNMYLNNKKTLTNNVKNYKAFLPKYFPLPHPSPLNFRWLGKNPWFETDVLPVLKQKVTEILS